MGAQSGFLASEIQGVQELVYIQEILALVLTPLAKQPLHRSESTDKKTRRHASQAGTLGPNVLLLGGGKSHLCVQY